MKIYVILSRTLCQSGPPGVCFPLLIFYLFKCWFVYFPANACGILSADGFDSCLNTPV